MNYKQILKNDDNVVVILEPTFSNKLDKNDYQIEIEYDKLPNNVKDEVINFFNSDEFIIDQAQNYAINEISI